MLKIFLNNPDKKGLSNLLHFINRRSERELTYAINPSNESNVNVGIIDNLICTEEEVRRISDSLHFGILDIYVYVEGLSARVYVKGGDISLGELGDYIKEM
ncbi:hypothetical protein FMLHJGGC_00064 [Staphylococcus phage BSwM-KMM1]|nr:hypothetical protein FMLHJGGC_00064 [Pseudomonas phage BSwM KMM1]